MSDTQTASLERGAGIEVPSLTGRGPRLRRRLRDVRARIPAPAWQLAAVVAGLYLAYVLIANLLLATPLLRTWLSAAPDELEMTYEDAWSIYPGRVGVRGLSLRFQDSNVQMLLKLESAEMSIDLLALARRRFHVRRVDAEGVALRLRTKVDEVTGRNDARVAAYPPIEGFRDPPVRTPQDEPTNPADLWTIHLEDVHASVRELWLLELRYRGAGSIDGGLFLRPLRELALPTSTLVAHGGVLMLGERPILSSADARVEIGIEDFDVSRIEGAAILRQVTARAEARATLQTLAPLSDAYLPPERSLEGGAGPISVVAHVDHGIVRQETRVDWRTDDVTLRWDELALRGPLAFVGHVETGRERGDDGRAAAGRPAIVGEANFAHAGLTYSGKELVVLGETHGRVRSEQTDLTGSFPVSSAKIGVASATASDLEAFGALLPEGVRMRSGRARGALHALFRDGRLDGRADVTLEGAEMVTPDVTVGGSGKIWAIATSRDARSGIELAGSGISLSRAALRIKDAHAEGLAIDLDVRDGLMRTADTPKLHATLGVRVSPGDRLLKLGASLASVPKPVAEAPAGPTATANLRISADEKAVDVRIREAVDGDLHARGRLRKRTNAKAKGAVLLSIGPIHAGVEVSGGDTHVTPSASNDWLERKTE